MTRPLDPLAFPLRGSQLVEASAGTGKTFTISALYLRLVLGHGGEEAGFGRPLDPPQILVVTFTEAATKELRERVRQRLAEAAAVFSQEAAPGAKASDALLYTLRASYPEAQWPDCARRLQLAAQWMDESAISTIHGWCQRMLREHAFDSGSLFEQALLADARELQDEAVRDWWRSFVYPLGAQEVARLAGWWPTPEALGADLQRLFAHRDRLSAGAEPRQALRAAEAEAAARVEECKRPWREWVDDLEQAIESALAARRLDGKKFTRRKDWLKLLRAWAEGDAQAPGLTGTAWDRLTPQGMREASTAEPPFTHPALDDLATLQARLQALPDGREPIQCHAVHWIAQRVAAEKQRRAEIDFDDMLTQLDGALRHPRGGRLAERIRAQFPVALIDEFQDTDEVQYRIFDAIYPVRANAPGHALVLIGDPKQAIYSFRGADIHTYLAAKADTEGRHSTLATNHRSSEAMVAAVNHVFGQAERRPDGRGAFLFGGEQGNPLGFEPVGARGRPRRWAIDGAEAPALVCWWRGAAEGLREAMAQACASEVLRLLELGRAGRAGFAAEGEPLQPVQPGDMAVLVNNGSEAQAVRQALAHLGIRSVYLSDSESVFQAEVAADLQRLLAACANPEDERLLRAALATPLLALDWAALERLNVDEAHAEATALRFRGYRDQWRRQGVLPMLMKLLHDHGVPHRLRACEDERRLTDVLHLAELLQQDSVLLDGEQALVRHLAQRRAEPGAAGQDGLILRLESDAELLKVVTVHKSKGLEYPLVFLPFACNFREVGAGDLPLRWHEGGGQRLSMRPDPQALAAADEERLQEDVRKLYVALTRARFATWVGVAPVRQLERSGLGSLLAGPDRLDAAGLQARLAAWAQACGSIAMQDAPEPAGGRWQPPAAARAHAGLPPLPAAPAPWWVASYSRLRQQEDAPLVGEGGAAGSSPADEDAAPETAAEATFLESAQPAPALLPASATAAPGLHAFPRGAVPGSFLHGLLEWAGREGFAQVAGRGEDLRRVVAQRCEAQGWSAWAGPLADWLQAWLHAPLAIDGPGQGPRPAGLRGYQVEMEFWFATRRARVEALDRLVLQHTVVGAPRRPLQPSVLQGMFKGFIDLVFEHEGRWWVLDYKSNALGAEDADYTATALREEVLRHRYELQYTLYLFALHRHLRARLPHYDYERHVGGAAYLFLRGQGGPARGLHLERPPAALMDALDALFSAEEASA